MRLIPGKTKVKIELFKGVTLTDLIVGMVGLVIVTLCSVSSLPGRWIFALVVALIFAMLLFRLDSEPFYVFVWHMLRYKAYPSRLHRLYSDEALVRNETGTRQDTIDAFFEDDGAEKQVEEADKVAEKEKKEQLKAIIKEEDKILKSKTATEEEKNAVWQARAERTAAKKKEKELSKDADASYEEISEYMPFTGISDGFIEYNGEYYGAAIEIDPIEFRFFSEYRRNNSIELCLGQVLRSLSVDSGANIVKVQRPVVYDEYLDAEYDKLDALKSSYESGLLSEEELKARVEIQYDRINEVISLCNEDKVIEPFYYLVLFEHDKGRLGMLVNQAIDLLEQGEMQVRRLDDKGLALFLKYTNCLDFDEKEIDKLEPDKWVQWAMPEDVKFSMRKIEVNGILTHNLRVVNYPSVVGDSWLAGVMSFPGTKVVVKLTPMDREKSIKAIDRSLSELRGQYMATSLDSKLIELQEHIDTLSTLLVTLQRDNEALLSANIYITAYDAALTKLDPILGENFDTLQPAVADIKKAVRRSWGEAGMTLSGMDFLQMQSFIGSQISMYDPLLKDARGIPSNTIAGMFPWIYAHISDKGGIKLGKADGVPVFIDFFQRNEERVNSNMVIVGKSGSGKSYATKSLLTNLASEDAKIFILDPENEYSELAHTLHGKVINVGNAKYGRLNPFHIITALDDDEAGEEGGGPGGSFATHLQFLEEFFRQILPDIDRDALEYLNSLVERLYLNFGITAETDLSTFGPEDYPIFDDLYDVVLAEFERTNNEYLRQLLRSLVNYIAKFSTGGRNANIWNGPSTITTDENFSVFNFQSMLANRNSTIANAQMLLVLKYVDNEIIKNRDYNLKYGLNRKIVVVIDEAHVFIDTKFPIALDFMFQLAKRIRKYNGMQIVITQNIKDFVGSEEIARKSSAIINACQYSFVFGLAPNDMADLCKLYEKAGGINEQEQDDILSAKRGQAFTIMSPTSRSSFAIEVPSSFVEMFESPHFMSHYFTDEPDDEVWESFVADSREKHDINFNERKSLEEATGVREERRSTFTFSEVSEDEFENDIRDFEDDGFGDDFSDDAFEAALAKMDRRESEPDIDDVLDDKKESISFGGITLSEISAEEAAVDSHEENEANQKQSAVDKMIAAEEVVNRKEYEMATGRGLDGADIPLGSDIMGTGDASGAIYSQADLNATLEQFKQSMREEMEKELAEKIKWISLGASMAGGGAPTPPPAAEPDSTASGMNYEPKISKVFDDSTYDEDMEEFEDYGSEQKLSSDYDTSDYDTSDYDTSDESSDYSTSDYGTSDDTSDYSSSDGYESYTSDSDEFEDLFSEDDEFMKNEDYDDLFKDDPDSDEELSFDFGDEDLDDEYSDSSDESAYSDDSDDFGYGDEDEDNDDLDSLFSDDDDEGEEYEPAPFLFAELLAEAADEYASKDIEDRLNESGEDVIEVTLEELKEYIKKQRKKR